MNIFNSNNSNCTNYSLVKGVLGLWKTACHSVWIAKILSVVITCPNLALGSETLDIPENSDSIGCKNSSAYLSEMLGCLETTDEKKLDYLESILIEMYRKEFCNEEPYLKLFYSYEYSVLDKVVRLCDKIAKLNYINKLNIVKACPNISDFSTEGLDHSNPSQ